MNLKRILGLLLISSVPLCAHAAAAEPTYPPLIVGAFQSVLKLCSKIDDRDEDRFDRLSNAVARGYGDDDEVDKLRKNGDYQRGYAAGASWLNGLTRNAALGQCQAVAKLNL